MGRPSTQVCDQGFERVEVMPNVVGDADPAIGSSVERKLEGREKAFAARNPAGDEA